MSWRPARYPAFSRIHPGFDRVGFGNAEPVRLPEERCWCCMFPATRRVWVRWGARWTTSDAVPVCDEHAYPATSRFKAWLSSIRPEDFKRRRRLELKAEEAADRAADRRSKC